MEASGRFVDHGHHQHQGHGHHQQQQRHPRRSGWDSSSARDGYDEAYDPEPGGSMGDSRHRRHSRRHLDDTRSDSAYSRDCWEHDKYDASDYRQQHRSSRDFGDSRRRHDYEYDDLDKERGRRRDKDRGGGGRHGGRERTSDAYTPPDESSSPYTAWQDESKQVQEEQQVSVQTPTGTIVVKGLSQKTVEDDLYRALERWGPLKHVRVIKEKSSGVSRGFAFVDLPSVDAAEKLMAAVGTDGLIVNGRRLFLEYSRPSAGASSEYRFSGQASKAVAAVPSDWICALCGYLNFARRIVCLQCNEARGEEATDVSTCVYRASEPAPSHVLAVRGLDDNVDEEILHYEFSKHAPIKDLRLIRDKFTHVSRGYAFIHFHSVDDAVKALEASNGTAIDKNGQILRVAFAKSPYGVHGGPLLAAAAASAAASCAQQYDVSGWEPKEYEDRSDAQEGDKASGFVWDEASGYYYDASTKFYYDANRNLYYDGTHGIWYTFNPELQQYQPYTEDSTAESAQVAHAGEVAVSEVKDKPSNRKQYANAVISAPAVVRSEAAHDKDKVGTPPELSGVKKDKTKEVRLTSASKPTGKKKLNNTFNLWKQRMNEGSDAEQVVRTEESEGTSSRPGSKRRFTETTPQYRDRAAERRSLYGLSVPGDPMEGANEAAVLDAGEPLESYEAAAVDKAIGEDNVGNRMLRSMGWQEGSGLGKEGTGIVEPVQAHVGSERAGLGSKRSRFEAQPGDSYRSIIQKKSFARFHDML